MAEVYINDFSLACAMGMDRATIARSLRAPKPSLDTAPLFDGRRGCVARLPVDLQPESNGTRTNAITSHLLDGIAPALSSIAPDRIGVVIGTSTTGIGEAVQHLKSFRGTDVWPPGMNFDRQLLGDTSQHAADVLGATGPAYTISTACTSGSKAIITGARMIRAGLVDAVVCGGVDAYTDFTLNGFAALESVSPTRCNPFSRNRDGIAIGEGGALFVLSARPGPWRLEGWGESSDAHHISAPDPEGAGGEMAIRNALNMAGKAPGAIDHIHLHGTATPLNDSMESKLVERMFGLSTPAASTKGATGHTLGAAGALQVALSLVAMGEGLYPPHVWDGEPDPELPQIRLSEPGVSPDRPQDCVMTLNFAFGGSNVALILGRA